ncbi:MAG: hypothetical protein LBU79_08950 [Planctomycetota bacterium]|nr:hypothetical protein [Planctomycetota bacterium]
MADNSEYLNAPIIETQEGGLPTRGEYWETWNRCGLILLLLSSLLFLTWRPGVARLNLLLTYINPSHGDSLSWRAVDDPLPPPAPTREAPPPAEWRLSSLSGWAWPLPHPGSRESLPGASQLTQTYWRRFTDNSWSWQDDHPASPDHIALGAPPQKGVSSFRAGDATEWPPASVKAEDILNLDNASPLAGFFNQPEKPAPNSLAAILAELPSLPPLAEEEPAATADAFASLPLSPANPASGPENLAKPAPEAESAIDWKNREITGPLENAYLLIYPRLRFVGLCLPGEGYIRKYNQVGVPSHLEGDKSRADDGHTPYGRYYIAERYSDSDGPRLFLSWPSPADARRAGASEEELRRVEEAWERLELPPQDTPAGGGVGLNGLRQWVESTDGGFTLEAPHMEEIFTALPSGARVLIEP